MAEIRIEKQSPDGHGSLWQRLGLTPLTLLSLVSAFASLVLLAVTLSAEPKPGAGRLVLALPILAALVSTVSYFKAPRR